jgi:hypothetical protein
MVEKVITSPRADGSARNVVDFARYQAGRNAAGKAFALSARTCRHCGAALAEGEREDECSSASNDATENLRWQAAQILRGLI